MGRIINFKKPLSFDYSCRIEEDIQERTVYSRTLMHSSITLRSSEETWPQFLEMALTCPESCLIEVSVYKSHTNELVSIDKCPCADINTLNLESMETTDTATRKRGFYF